MKRGSLSLKDSVIDAMPNHMSLEKVVLCECSSNSKNNNKQYFHSSMHSRTTWMHNDTQ